MSRVVDNAIEKVRESSFNFLDNGRTLEVLNAVIFWTNFRGEANKFGNSARTFNLAINEELAQVLSDHGWRVREVVGSDEESKLYFVNIKINMSSQYPPRITLFNEFNGKKNHPVTITIDNIGELDRIDIKTADCLINAYSSKTFQGKVTGYLRKLNIIQEVESEFGGKYDDWLDDESIFLTED